ncbi:hypothetical protein [Acidithiobacillus ferrooxidans]|uniref:hypothetical protein n=1 Tax=Acidithiobacillus ferrooxidans TaxID=920 RepID=UPI000A9EBFDF|nr:hypothetical protein [Acidithiobacillus ferrooxidans]MBU2819405.1 hypothetical protein [Acidithiobacillus ferrooxidans]MCR1344058.1 hypothetical protein [Acidithiobacillus ferrooxidans]QZT53235.1 hypothetical protein K7B00_03275 [Acidithiobacillus ferrooxidans]BDB13329.1 hypothetical protein ANFP_06490 [Acidithiobacillus ferrooxidans]
MKDFIWDTKVMLLAVVGWTALCVYGTIAHLESPLFLLLQSGDLGLLVWLTFRAWKRGV